MNAPFLHRSLTEAKNTFLNEVLTSDIIYGDSGSFNFRNDIWTSQYEQLFPMLYSEGYAIHEHLAPFGLSYLKERTGFFAEGPDIGTSGFYNNLSIDDDLGNVNSSIETGCNTHRQTDWVKDKPGQEAYFDKNVTSKDDPDLKGRIYVGKTFIELRENNFIYYGDEKGDLYQDPRPIFSFKKDTREAQGQGVDFSLATMYTHFQFGGGEPMTINMSSVNFGGATQKQLGLTGMTVGQTRSVNLFNASPLNQAALAFGRVRMQYYGNDQFSIVGDKSSRFDFWPLIDTKASAGRNAGNLLGAAINYNLIISPAAILIPSIFGGLYDVNFTGTTTIHK